MARPESGLPAPAHHLNGGWYGGVLEHQSCWDVAGEHLGDGFVDLVELRVSAMTRVLPGAWRAKTSARSCRVPTIEPMISMPFSTVSKIGMFIVLRPGGPRRSVASPAQ